MAIPIVQLEENGVRKYTKTHAAAIDGIDGVLVKATGNENIGGNKNFTGAITLNSKRLLTVDDLPTNKVNLTVGGGNVGSVILSRIGKVVTIFFVGLLGKSSGGNDSVILTVPDGNRTAVKFEALAGSIDRSILHSCAIAFETNGQVLWRRNSSYASYYTFAVTYQIP